MLIHKWSAAQLAEILSFGVLHCEKKGIHSPAQGAEKFFLRYGAAHGRAQELIPGSTHFLV